MKINETVLVGIAMVVIAIPLFAVYQNKKGAKEILQKQQAKELAVQAENEKFLEEFDKQEELRKMSQILEAIKKVEAEQPPRITGNETDEEIYNNPYIKHIRTALNGYLSGSNIGAEEVVVPNVGGQEVCGLDSFDRTYYKSKFIVYNASDGDYGGVQAYIVFVDKPELFWAWVYRLSGGEYTLRGFCKVGPPDETKQEFLQEMQGYIKSGKMRFSL
ncbi:MAG: hypothetical protein AAB966_01995 [Patescibacteria group bacterium]